jgi:hypothetical protein
MFNIQYSKLRKGWWAVAFCLLVGVIYGQGIRNRNEGLRQVTAHLAAIEQEYHLALREKENLNLRLASQSDPAWIELVLLRQMGVVPEGFLKVHFKK